MAATSATSLVDKMHYCGFLITRVGTGATSLVDKMHFCKFMERERVRRQIRYRYRFIINNGWNKRDIFI